MVEVEVGDAVVPAAQIPVALIVCVILPHRQAAHVVADEDVAVIVLGMFGCGEEDLGRVEAADAVGNVGIVVEE